MKPVKYKIQIEITAIAIVFAVLYAIAAWSIWVIECFTGVRGSTFWMAVFLVLVSGILPQQCKGLPVLLLSIATLYIWILL